MIAELKEQWHALRRGQPGRRFQDRYKASRDHPKRKTVIQRVVRIGIATIAVAIGVVLVFIPGPAILFFALAGALLATESRGVARFLDWCEVVLRRLLRWSLRRWKAMSLAGRIVVLTVAATGTAGAAYLSYRVMFG